MTAYSLSSAAKATLVDIHAYTTETFGPKQADKYIDGLFAVFNQIAARTERGRMIPAEFNTPGFFVRHQSHYVYWHEDENGIIGIAAILHVSMLQGERLASAFRTLPKS